MICTYIMFQTSIRVISRRMIAKVNAISMAREMRNETRSFAQARNELWSSEMIQIASQTRENHQTSNDFEFRNVETRSRALHWLISLQHSRSRLYGNAISCNLSHRTNSFVVNLAEQDLLLFLSSALAKNQLFKHHALIVIIVEEPKSFTSNFMLSIEQTHKNNWIFFYIFAINKIIQIIIMIYIKFIEINFVYWMANKYYIDIS